MYMQQVEAMAGTLNKLVTAVNSSSQGAHQTAVGIDGAKTVTVDALPIAAMPQLTLVSPLVTVA